MRQRSRGLFEKRKVLLSVVLVLSMFFDGSMSFGPVEASDGTATVYFLNLSNPDPGTRGFAMDRSRVIAGGIEATTPMSRSDNVPAVHPKWGKSSPYFYSVSYKTVTDWHEYLDIVSNRVGAIMLNVHGEVLPVPSGYSREGWTDKIAEAMLSRRLTWINVGGYPFFYSFYYSTLSMETWGEGGFQHLVSWVLGTNGVTLWPPADCVSNDCAGGLYGAAASGIYGPTAGWPKYKEAKFAKIDRPLKLADFKDIVLLPLYASSVSGQDYWEAAALIFAKPGKRFDPNSMNGFGNFVHLGTSQTYRSDNTPTDTDFYRGYMTVAAAIWAEASRVSPRTETSSSTLFPGKRDLTLHVSPVLLGSYQIGGTWTVRLGFGLYGGELASRDVYDFITNVVVNIDNEGRAETMLKADLQSSRNGKDQGVKLQGGFQIDPNFSLAAGTLTFMLGFYPPLTPFVIAADGLLLLSDWASVVLADLGAVGVGIYDSYVYFSYTPLRQLQQTPTDNISEFQSWIIVDVQMTPSAFDWVMFPIGYNFHVNTNSGIAVEVGGEVSLALNSGGLRDTVTIFHEDFQGDFSDWRVGDLNSVGGLDYWGPSSLAVTSEPSWAWPAQVGENSVLGGVPNTQALRYDKGMDAYLDHDLSRLNLKGYRSVTLTYRILWAIKTGDSLRVESVLSNGEPTTLKEYLGDNTWHLTYYESPIAIPQYAQVLRFRFLSNNDNDVWYGPRIDHVDLQGEIPNDPNIFGSGLDAGDTQAEATSLWTGIDNYGYLANDPSDPEDWYKFSVQSGSTFEAKIDNLAPGEVLKVELNGLSCTGSDTIRCTGSGGSGESILRIYPGSGYGSYHLIVTVTSSGGGGGGPPRPVGPHP